MRVVNPYYIGAVLEPFLYLGDEQAEKFAQIDSNDGKSVRECLRKLIVPYFATFDEKSKQIVKDSLRFLLVTGCDKWGVLTEMNQCPIDIEGAPVRFFESLWAELFGEPMVLDAPESEYIVKEDFQAPNLIRRAKLPLS